LCQGKRKGRKRFVSQGEGGINLKKGMISRTNRPFSGERGNCHLKGKRGELMEDIGGASRGEGDKRRISD